MVVSWFSCGVSSAVATKIALSKYPDLKIIYTHIDDQHPDTMRFLHDCEKWFDHEIEILQSDLRSVENACMKAGFVNSPYGAPCTRILKKHVRIEWEVMHPETHTYVWGYDVEEKRRADRIDLSMKPQISYFPLIEHELKKADVHGMLEKAGINRPAMYDLGYPNNNCIGCVKGGMGYWNKIRKDFPDVFESRCKMEENIGGRVFKEFSLRDLPENRGRMEIVVPDCGIFCEIPNDN